jgi:putative ABC transport system ATP-binding protein
MSATPDRPDDVLASTGAAARAVALRKVYGEGEAAVEALRGVDIDFAAGAFTAIMGPSGSGKSTLMHCVAGLDTLTAGNVFIGQTDLSALSEKELTLLRRDQIGFVFQAFNLVPRTSALANVELPLSYAGLSRAERRARATAALEAVGMGARMDHLPSELSGGQQQRVAVARAIVTNPSLILADEPTGNLDSRSTRDVLNIFGRLNDEGRTVVLITHEDDVAARARRIIRLADGKIVSDVATSAGVAA